MNKNYPIDEVKIKIQNNEVIDFIKSLTHKPEVYFEIGCNIASTAKNVRPILDSTSIMYLFDFEENRKHTEIIGGNTIFIGCDSKCMFDSYNWQLMKLLNNGIKPDFVFIDGKHTFDTDWLCFFLIDNMMKPNGYIYFDDYNWTIQSSPTLNPIKFPPIKDHYTNEQISSKHIKILIDSIVKKKYKEILTNKLYQKIT